MTLAADLNRIAAEISLCAPDQSTRLRFLAVRVRRIEAALDEVVRNAWEDDLIARGESR